MNGEPNDFWGKLRREGDQVVEWHPLIDHCADVAACATALLERTLLRQRLARLGDREDLTPGQVARLCVLAALHDIGKFNLGFQAKGNPRLRQPPRGHVREVLTLISVQEAENARLCDALDVDRLNRWTTDPEDIVSLLVASICHHGRPVSLKQAGAYEALPWRPSGGLDPFQGIAALRAAAMRWFAEPLARDAEPLPAQAAFQHAFSGLIMLADWLGSDTHFFCYSEPGAADRFFSFSQEKAREVVHRMGLDPRAARQHMGPVGEALGQVLKGQLPRPLQREALALPCDSAGSLSILEAETGSGKTEAAIAHYLSLLDRGLVDGMYFALPTRTAATQIYKRIDEAMGRVFPDEDHRPPVIQAVPGYLGADGKDGVQLAHFKVLWHDAEERRMRYRGWAAEHPKRYLAGAVVIGTIDQVLLSALVIEHAHLRATALLRHLLVVDEVHASDPYMHRILEEVLSFHLRAGGHVLLMSATLGSVVRERLLSSSSPPSLRAAEAAPYPAFTYRPSGAAATVKRIDGAGRSKTVTVVLSPILEDAQAIAAAALEAAEQGANVLILRNTVSACIETQLALEGLATQLGKADLCFTCAGRPAPHHARFSQEDRQALDHEIERIFGKEAQSCGRVAVATQTVQQSLDLDADLLLTDLCPMDVLLQRIGRLHRHIRPRPTGFGEPKVVVLVPAERTLHCVVTIRPDGDPAGPCGLGTVYADLRVVEATWRSLECHPSLVIPEMNRSLVEATTHPEALHDVLPALGPGGAKHVEFLEAGYYGQRQHARLNLVNRTVPFGDELCAFPDRELDRRIRSRLGEDDRLVHFEPPQPGPFDRPLSKLTVPAWFVDGIDRDDLQEVARVHEASGDQVSFTLDQKDSRLFVYDRLGLRRGETDHEDDLVDA